MRTPHTCCRRGTSLRIVLKNGEEIRGKFKDRTGKFVLLMDGRRIIAGDIKVFGIYKENTMVEPEFKMRTQEELGLVGLIGTDDALQWVLARIKSRALLLEYNDFLVKLRKRLEDQIAQVPNGMDAPFDFKVARTAEVYDDAPDQRFQGVRFQWMHPNASMIVGVAYVLNERNEIIDFHFPEEPLPTQE